MFKYKIKFPFLGMKQLKKNLNQNNPIISWKDDHEFVHGISLKVVVGKSKLFSAIP